MLLLIKKSIKVDELKRIGETLYVGVSDEIKVANLTICCETRDEADVRNYP